MANNEELKLVNDGDSVARNSIADEAVLIAVKQLETSSRFKKPRMDEIKKNFDGYYGKVKKPLKGRYNIPVPTIPGFVDTYKAKIDEAVAIKFGYDDEADYKGSIKAEAMWRKDSSPQFGKWDMKDRGGKFLGIMTGVCIGEIYSESDPHYRNHFNIVHHEDFHCEPMGGQDLENHLFLGRHNVLKTKWDLMQGAKAGLYDKKQVARLINLYSSGEYKKNTKLSQDTYDSYQSMGLDSQTNSYVGQSIYNMTIWGMVYEGVRRYMVFNYDTGLWVRFTDLKEIFPVKDQEEELWPWLAWHTNEDPKLFWTKAPVDDMRPIADMIRILANQELENRARANAGMRMYDPQVVKNPGQLQWQPEGLVEGDSSVRPISEGIYEFKTPQLQGTINLIEWLDVMSGKKTGITPGSMGQAETERVGINVMNLQQTADRIGLTNKAYREFYVGLGVRYVRGLREHLPVGTAVKILGERGFEWDKFTQNDLNPIRDFDVKITGGNAELAQSEMKRKDRFERLMFLLKDPQLRTEINVKMAIEETLRGPFEDEEIRDLMDPRNYGNKEILSEAAQENQDLMKGKPVKPNRGATTGHVQKHLNFAYDKDLKPDQWARFMAHIEAEMPFALENMARMGIQANPMGTVPGQAEFGAQQIPSMQELTGKPDMMAGGEGNIQNNEIGIA